MLCSNWSSLKNVSHWIVIIFCFALCSLFLLVFVFFFFFISVYCFYHVNMVFCVHITFNKFGVSNENCAHIHSLSLIFWIRNLWSEECFKRAFFIIRSHSQIIMKTNFYYFPVLFIEWHSFLRSSKFYASIKLSSLSTPNSSTIFFEYYLRFLRELKKKHWINLRLALYVVNTPIINLFVCKKDHLIRMFVWRLYKYKTRLSRQSNKFSPKNSSSYAGWNKSTSK